MRTLAITLVTTAALGIGALHVANAQGTGTQAGANDEGQANVQGQGKGNMQGQADMQGQAGAANRAGAGSNRSVEAGGGSATIQSRSEGARTSTGIRSHNNVV